jgi:hypothetical protein
MWAIIICRRLGIEFGEQLWHRLSEGSDIFVMRCGWELVALLPNGGRVTGIKD